MLITNDDSFSRRAKHKTYCLNCGRAILNETPYFEEEVKRESHKSCYEEKKRAYEQEKSNSKLK